LAAGALTMALATGCSLLPALEEARDTATEQFGSALELERFRSQQVNWKPCYTRSEIDEILEFWHVDEDWQRNLECGSMAVPLDYDDPERERIQIALVRQPATGDAEQRRGSLVLNPGGPGGSGLDMLFDEVFSPEIREAYDLVSFDPRGVGGSDPVTCHGTGDDEAEGVGEDGPWADLPAWGLAPDDLGDDDLRELDELAREYADSCAEEAGEDLLAHIGTVDVARDLDLIRQVLGEDELSYVGYSYGTHLGSVYAELYPESVGAMVLDGGVDLDVSPADTLIEQIGSFQATWELFVEDCAAHRNNCAFSGPDRATGEMSGILAALDDEPLVIYDPEWASEEVVIDGGTALDIAMRALYHEELWPDLSDGLADVAAQDYDRAAYFLGYLYVVAYGHPDEEFDEADDVNADTARTAIECADHPVDAADLDTSDHRDLLERAHDASELFGGLVVWPLMVCSHWVQGEEMPTGFTAPGAPPIVVVGTVGDPATPYSWSRSLAQRLESATLVTYEGSGHGVYGFDRNECVDEVIDAYLLEGITPGSGHFCPPVG
jgi:pimeloyl-ACP methyl ester carboxylesterase